MLLIHNDYSWTFERAFPCQMPTMSSIQVYRPLAFSPDGERLVSATENGAAVLWNVSSGKSIATLTGHINDIWYIDFSSDGRRIVTASNSPCVHVWDGRTGAHVCKMETTGCSVNAAVFSPDCKSILTGNCVCSEMWDAATGAKRFTIKYPADSVAFSPDGKDAVLVGTNYVPVIVDAQTEAVRARLQGHTHFVYYVEYSADGRFILTISQDRTARVWRSDGALISELRTQNGIASGHISRTGDQVIISEYFGTVNIWNADGTGLKQPGILPASSYMPSRWTAFAPYGKKAAFSRYSSIIFCNTESGLTEPVKGGDAPSAHSGVFNRQGTRLATVGDLEAQIWHRARPDCWWGLICMTEFWLAVVLGIALCWSMWRDRSIV